MIEINEIPEDWTQDQIKYMKSTPNWTKAILKQLKIWKEY